MPFEIVRNDIVNMQVDVIVNTANPKPIIGAGTDAGIHKKAGPKLLKARQKIGAIPVGGAEVTPGFGLDARYVIHTVGPVWQGGTQGEEALLRRCYENSLRLAWKLGCKSIAFPLISAGNYAFPKHLALQIAMNAFSSFLMEREMHIYLVVFDKTAFSLSEKLFQGVKSYIDENYVTHKAQAQNIPMGNRWDYQSASPRREVDGEANYRRRLDAEEVCCSAVREPLFAPTMMPMAAEPVSLDKLLREVDAGFSETLLKLIDKTGKKDSEIYNRANVSRQHFSKIRNNPAYKPTKATAVAFAIALELSLEETRDLIGRAGYALTNSSKFDVIIMYFISHGNYNMFDINAALFEFDQSLLGT